MLIELNRQIHSEFGMSIAGKILLKMELQVISAYWKAIKTDPHATTWANHLRVQFSGRDPCFSGCMLNIITLFSVA